MHVANLNATSAIPGPETGPRPSAPPPPVADARRETSAETGRGAERAEGEHEFVAEGTRSATAASTKGEALQAQALVATLGEERARLTYDEELSRVFVEILDPQTGDVITRFPPQRLVEHLNSLAADDEPESDDDTPPVEGLSKLAGAGDESRSGGGATGKVLDELV